MSISKKSILGALVILSAMTALSAAVAYTPLTSTDAGMILAIGIVIAMMYIDQLIDP